jgi:hypothetical protein
MSWWLNWDGEKNVRKPILPRKDDCGRSKRKTCVCGGHNQNNPKRNMNHHATKKRHSIRLNRRFIRRKKYGDLV